MSRLIAISFVEYMSRLIAINFVEQIWCTCREVASLKCNTQEHFSFFLKKSQRKTWKKIAQKTKNIVSVTFYGWIYSTLFL